MRRPLTKHNHTGTRYARPPAVEAAIDTALAQDAATLRRRAVIRERRSLDFLPSEALVHLIREARRQNDDATFNALLPPLLTRCEANLNGTLRDDRAPNAADLREEVLSQFAELFASDGTGEHLDELDFFEVRFNSAFAALRIDLVRAEARRVGRQAPLPDGVEKGEPTSEDEAFARLPHAAFLGPATQESSVFRSQLLAAINALPQDEREVVVLVHVLGYEVESEDRAKRTAATICGVSGRTIRSRLARAAAKLSQFKEDA